MAIGEFGGAPASPGEGGLVLSSPMYWLWELSHAALNPARAVADATRLLYRNPINPLSGTTFGKSMAAAAELFERSTRRYGRPEWEIESTTVGGVRVPVHVAVAWERGPMRLELLALGAGQGAVHRLAEQPVELVALHSGFGFLVHQVTCL